MKTRDLIRRMPAIAVIFSVIASLTVLAPARAEAVQAESGTILHPATTGAVARNAWVASGGAVNGVSGYVFQVDPATLGQRFIMRTDDVTGSSDVNITFYSAYTPTGGTVCANYTFLNPFEAGRACGTLAAVWSFSGTAPLTFEYLAGPGVGYADTFDASPGISHEGRIDFTTGTDLAFEGNYAYVGSEDPSPLDGGLHVVDITDSSNPIQVGFLGCPAVQNDVAVWRGIVLMAIDSASSNNVCSPGLGKEGVRVVDARNPAQPQQIHFFDNVTGAGAHTISTVGDTGYAYVNNYPGASGAASATIDVIDLNPVLNGGSPTVTRRLNVGIGGQSGCHDITVVGTRAYCAALSHSEIWDISDPLTPSVLGRISNPLIDIHHSIAVEGNLMVIGDEFTGAEAAAGCTAGKGGPFGALWFYDISDPASPQVLGYFTPPEVYPGVRCTAHNFNIIPGTNLLVAAWYKGGTRVIDFSDPSKPVEAEHVIGDGSVTWSAYWYRDAIFTGDLHRGMDVFKLTDTGPTVEWTSSAPPPPLNINKLYAPTGAEKAAKGFSCRVIVNESPLGA